MTAIAVIYFPKSDFAHFLDRTDKRSILYVRASSDPRMLDWL